MEKKESWQSNRAAQHHSGESDFNRSKCANNQCLMAFSVIFYLDRRVKQVFDFTIFFFAAISHTKKKLQSNRLDDDEEERDSMQKRKIGESARRTSR